MKDTFIMAALLLVAIFCSNAAIDDMGDFLSIMIYGISLVVFVDLIDN